ncbi:MAG: hypothetical protein IT343_22465 [Candidatus Melainabacteria bacterium]|nr:hypothetical protein [Candidatus Melainabacteria bacterium]
MEMMKKAAELADEMISTVGWLLNRASSSSKLYDISDAKGLTAEVSVSIQGAKPGEVVVLLGHSLRNFSARAVNGNDVFERGSKVVIVDSGANVVYVKSFVDAEIDSRRQVDYE